MGNDAMSVSGKTTVIELRDTGGHRSCVGRGELTDISMKI